MNNYIVIYVFNFLLRKEFGEVDQRGLLVVLDRFRFDFIVKVCFVFFDIYFLVFFDFFIFFLEIFCYVFCVYFFFVECYDD